jgi:hypothetical protein
MAGWVVTKDSSKSKADRSKSIPGAVVGAVLEAPKLVGETVDVSQDPPGMTLPPLALDGDNWEWGNNTLPPLLDWEDMGI